MCGIAGYVGGRQESVAIADVRRMCQTIVHRGPDDEGVAVRGPAALGMRRLSIIDVSGGQQPIHNEDRTVWIVFNGEIYNFKELRADLETKGHKFYTHSDTEVIVHLYEDLGADCVKKLRGMFAFAIYDERRHILLLARDRMGKKPLFYALDRGRLYFGSEIKAILAVAPHLAEVDAEGILQYFYFNYIPDPHTAYKKIHKLPPGHRLESADGKVRVEQYWELPEYGTSEIGSEEECLEELEKRLAEAVRIRLISEVPLGALLSGGVDSSIVVALMARASSSAVKTFSIGFENQDFSELPYAKALATRFGTDHHELVVDPNLWHTLQKLTGMMEEPFGDSSMIPTYHVSEMARQHVTVALAGDGGDELFAGYDRYALHMSRRHSDAVPAWLGQCFRSAIYPHLPAGMPGRKFSWNVSLSARDRYLDGITFLPACHREGNLFSREYREAASGLPDPLQQFRDYYDRAPAKDSLSRLLYLDTKTYLTADVLAKVDRMSMAASLEVRAPILDHEFVEFVTSLPARWKYRDGVKKYIFKKLAERLGIPKDLLYRRKQGFALPLVHWMRRDMKHELRDILLDARSTQRGYFDAGAVRRAVEEHISGTRDHPGVLWQMLVFEMWHRNFLERIPKEPEPRVSEVASERASENIPLENAEEIAPGAACSKAPLRVAIVAPSLRKVGGQSVQAGLLLRKWRSDPAVQARLVPIDPEFPRAIAWMERVPLLRTFVRVPIYAGRLWREFSDVDVVHIFSASYWSFWLAPAPAWAMARLRGRATVLNYHSGEALDHLSRSGLARVVLRWMGKKVVPSAYLGEVFQKFGLEAEVIANAVDADLLPYRRRSEIQPILICTRGCEPYYAVDDVLRAFGLVQAAYPQAQLILAGGGSREGEMRQVARKLGLNHVEFAGRVGQEEIGNLYRRADIFINASTVDNMPVSLLEAFTTGLPVVSTSPGGIRYLVEHERTGLLCSPENWQALGENALRIVREPGLGELLADNARHQAQDYTWERVRLRWLQVYSAAARRDLQSQPSAVGPRPVDRRAVGVEAK